MFRQIAGIAWLGLGVWIAYGALYAVHFFVSRGGSLDSALLEPPTSLLRLIGAGLLCFGGSLVGLRMKGGVWVGLSGAAMITILGVLMASAGALQDLWIDEILIGVAAGVLGVLILTLKRI